MSIIINKQNSRNYIWGNTCKSYLLCETKNLSVKLETMPVNTKDLLHFHTNTTQVFFILKGKATFEVDNTKFTVNVNESIMIQPLQKHFILNDAEEELEFLVISQPSAGNDRINISNF